MHLAGKSIPSIQGICGQFLTENLISVTVSPPPCGSRCAYLLFPSRQKQWTEAMDNILTLDIRHLDIYPHVPSLPSPLRGWPRFRVETSQIIFRHSRSRGHVFCLHSTWDFENRESEQNSKLSLVTFSQD